MMYHISHDTRITISFRLAWTIAVAILAGVLYIAIQIGLLQGSFDAVRYSMKAVEENREAINQIGLKIDDHELRLLKLELPVNP